MSERSELITNISGELQNLLQILGDAACDQAFLGSVEEFNAHLLEQSKNITPQDQLMFDLRFLTLKWLNKIHEIIQLHTKTYQESFEDLSKISDKLQTGIVLVGEKIKEKERQYGLSILSFLLILNKETGATIFKKNLGNLKLDTALVGGFLQALQNFGSEIGDTDGSMRTLTYQKYQFQIESGAFIRAAIVLRGSPNDYVIARLKEFVKHFEVNFEADISEATEDIEVFQPANALFDVIFK